MDHTRGSRDRARWLSHRGTRSGEVDRRVSRERSVYSCTHQLGGVQRRVRAEWRKLELEPIGLHESRHTAATWLDHAGVSPKVASALMGDTTPEYQPGAASITLRRYTHPLPGELERARDLLDAFLMARSANEETSG
jgi:integrase